MLGIDLSPSAHQPDAYATELFCKGIYCAINSKIQLILCFEHHVSPLTLNMALWYTQAQNYNNFFNSLFLFHLIRCCPTSINYSQWILFTLKLISKVTAIIVWIGRNKDYHRHFNVYFVYTEIPVIFFISNIQQFCTNVLYSQIIYIRKNNHYSYHKIIIPVTHPEWTATVQIQGGILSAYNVKLYETLKFNHNIHLCLKLYVLIRGLWQIAFCFLFVFLFCFLLL